MGGMRPHLPLMAMDLDLAVALLDDLTVLISDNGVENDGMEVRGNDHHLGGCLDQ